MLKALYARSYCLTLMVVLSVMIASLAAVAQADDRIFPAGIKRGVLNAGKYPDIVINGKVRITTPSLRIIGDNNLLILPASLPNADLKINYLENDYGEIQRMWILTEYEASRPLSTTTK